MWRESFDSTQVIFVKFGERIALRKLVILKAGTRASEERAFIRAASSFDASYDGDISPFTHDQSLKNRWLMTSSVAGLFGALVIGGAFFLTFDGNQIVATKFGQDTKLSSRNPQKSMIDAKADQTAVFIGDVPIITDKNITEQTSPGAQYTNVAVTFGRSKLKANRVNGTDAPGNGATVVAETKKPIFSQSGKQASLNSATLGAIDLGGRVSSILGYQSSKPTVLSQTQKDTEFSISGASPRDAASNVTRVTKREPLNKPAKIPYQTVSISAGDSLIDILTDKGAFLDDARSIVATLKSYYSSSLKEGQKVTFALAPATRGGKQVMVPETLELTVGPEKRLTIVRDEYGKFTLLSTSSTSDDVEQYQTQAKIKKSLYLAARNQGIPDKIIADMMRIHSYDVDFQREVRVGDSFEVFYDKKNSRSKPKNGTVLFSSLTLSGNTKNFYRFKTTDDNVVDYYDDSGRSAKKFLIRNPVDGARLTSPYGMRVHPITGLRRMHKGVDLAAPRGTPIKITGNGVVIQKGGARGLGNFIKIRHANGYVTSYAHMDRYGPGIKKGKKVRQGQIVGYVGSTGRSTGNHLHYQVELNRKTVNPFRIKVPTGRQLTGKMLALYKKQKAKIDTLRATAPASTRVAAAREAQRKGIN